MKPLGHKNYGSIPHLLGSKLGPGDHHVHEGQHRICTEKVRDKHDVIIIQEKYNGSNVGIAKNNGQILALTRSGWLADSSPYHQHHIFAEWVRKEYSMFDSLLNEGERIAGEWLYQAHGLKYKISTHPFLAFDFFDVQNNRLGFQEFDFRIHTSIPVPRSWFFPAMAVPVSKAIEFINRLTSHRISCKETPEGVIYRVERKGKVDFLAKYVRPDFEPGKYLPEMSGNDPVYNCELSQFLNNE